MVISPIHIVSLTCTTALSEESSPPVDPSTYSDACTPRKASFSPKLAGQNDHDMSNQSPLQAYLVSDDPIGSDCDNAADQTSTAGRDGLLEQKIFPGIVHERAQRGNVPGGGSYQLRANGED
ncbi:hypothetical protein BDW66DRAFT_34978 [Aspergillus desertorum]